MRIALGTCCLLVAACQYGYDLKASDRQVVNCTGHWDCGDGEVCRGIVSEEVACTGDGYLRVDDGKATIEPVDDEPSLFFFCHEGRRFFPFCVSEQVTECEDEDPCGGDQVCASPVDGGAADCVAVEESPPSCENDGNCTTGECYLVFVLGQDADSKGTEKRCADCTSCIF